MNPINGEIRADVGKDILKLSYVTQDGCYDYLIRGMGLNRGAFATSNMWESYGILEVGVNPEDMAYAVHRIIEKGKIWQSLKKVRL